MNHKSVIATGGVLLVAAVLFGACARGDDAPVAEEQPYELIWYNIGAPQRDHQIVIDQVNAIVQPRIGVRLEMRYVDWGDYNERLRVIAASGQPYDLAFTAMWANDYVANARRGAFMPLNDLLQQHGSELYETVYPAFWEAAAIDGTIYGVPANKELGQQEMYIFNRRLVERYGFELAESYTFAELEPMLEVVQRNEPDITAYNINNQQTPFVAFDTVVSLEVPVGFAFESDPTRVVNLYATEMMRQELDTLRRDYLAGYIPAEAPMTPEKEGYNSDANTNWFARRATYQPFAENLWSGLYGVEVVVVPVNERPYVNSLSALGSLQAISITSEQPEKAMQFLNLINTDLELRNLLAFGIEGVHYELDDQGKLVELPRMDDYRVPQFTLGNIFDTHIKASEPDAKWEVFGQFNASGLAMPSLGFVFDNSAVRTEIAAISNISQEFQPALNTGAVDPRDYNERYLARMDEAGLDRVIEEVQRQYDAWRAANRS